MLINSIEMVEMSLDVLGESGNNRSREGESRWIRSNSYGAI